MLSAAPGYCVGLITPASLAGAVSSQLAVRSTPASLAGYVVLLRGSYAAFGTRCVGTAHGT